VLGKLISLTVLRRKEGGRTWNLVGWRQDTGVWRRDAAEGAKKLYNNGSLDVPVFETRKAVGGRRQKAGGRKRKVGGRQNMGRKSTFEGCQKQEGLYDLQLDVSFSDIQKAAEGGRREKHC